MLPLGTLLVMTTRRTALEGPGSGLTLNDLRSRTTCTIEEAAEVLGLGRSGAYAAARRGEIPVLRIGRRMVVPVGRLVRLLEGDDSATASGDLVG